ncbi:succinate dehydrogenase assembly factor 2, mitochondrial-like [Amphiura filiformis]|uniref:succinate dehydrogenase assembly factor 2, mitochondrial-like n=1 Tax=Amphiura filiformis TaxID=82378 RepID=UPI003B21ADDF
MHQFNMAASMGRIFHRSVTLFHRFTTVPHQCILRPLASNANPPVSEPPIPEWKQPTNETVDLQRARLVYQSRKRGMTENGLLLSTFADKYLNSFNKEELQLYDVLINKPNNDWDLFHWMVGHKPTPKEYDNTIMDRLKEHACNNDMESRITQPSLPEREGREY